MAEQIVHILKRYRRRLLAVRAIEAAAVGAAAGGLLAASGMAARILSSRFPAVAAGMGCAALLTGTILLASRRARAAVSEDRAVGWLVAVTSMLVGAGVVLCVLLGRFGAVPKDSLLAILPILSAAAAGVVIARGASLDRVARLLDERAALRERLATALEVGRSAERSEFAEAVVRQAAAAGGRLPKVMLWNRSRALAGAAGLSVMAALLMLPWTPIETLRQRRDRAWQAAAERSGESLAEALARMEGDVTSVGADEQIAALRALVNVLRTGQAGASETWRGKVVELDRIAEAIRRRIRSGELPPEQARRLAGLLRAVEQAAADVAETMTGAGEDYAGPQPAGVDPSGVTPATPAAAPTGWTNVYNPHYGELVGPTSGTAPGEDVAEAVATEIPFDREWAAARARSEASERRGDVPMRYRQVIRDYFAENP